MPLFITGCSGAKSDQNQEQERHNWQTENLKGAVKSYTQSVYLATEKFGEMEKGDRVFYAFSIEDDFENITATYNEKGNLIEVSEYDPISGSLRWKTKYVYDDTGKQIEKNWYDSDGDLESKTKFLYDEKGNLIETDFYESDGSFDGKIMYTYDEKGNEIERKDYMSGGSLYSKVKSIYDDNGNKIKSSQYQSDGSLDVHEKYVYDKNGNRIEVSWSGQNLNGKMKIAYDDKGNPIEWSNHDSEGNSEEGKYTYQYDKKGNWTKMVIYKNGVYENIIEREYTYY